MNRDTIFALATPPGRSGVAVVRVSGPDSGSMLEALGQRPLPEPRKAVLRRLKNNQDELIDQALVLWFPSPASFSGEDSIELHLHGGPSVIDAALEALLALGGRPAEAGEFTRRAFETGKLDLTEAEGLADLIEAETRGQREQALAQMSGSLRLLYEDWRHKLISIMAAIEGEIDFPDEEGVPEALARSAGEGISALLEEMGAHLDDNQRGEKIRKGFDIAIIGLPNAGKSSLLNALSSQDAAIVTDIPGTTRDIVEVRMVLGGFPVTLADTAGIRETEDRVEQEGVRRALTRADSADLVLGLVDGGLMWSDEMTRVVSKADIVVVNKVDSGVRLTLPDMGVPVLNVSALTGEGLEALEVYLTAHILDVVGAREVPALTRVRHRRNVEQAVQSLERARDQLGQPELAGEDMRLAVRALETLTGRVDVEDVLGEIFSRFCIGK